MLLLPGEGGNDLLGTRHQVDDQALKRGNAAFIANIGLGIPVRVTKKMLYSASDNGSCFVYDGLYDVVSWWLRGMQQTFVCRLVCVDMVYCT